MKGEVEVREIHSPALERNPLGDPPVRRTPIYLPPGYRSGRERYPAIYFLHGFSGSGASWLNSSAFTPNVPERVDRLIASGAVPPFIAVFVDGWTALGGSQWINSQAIGRYRDYLAQEVVGWVDRELRTIPKAAARAVIGKSSGGYGALVMGRHHPDVFAHLGCHSGDACFEYCYLADLPKAASALLKAGGPKAWFDDFVRRAAETKARGEDHAVIGVLAMSAAYSPNGGEALGLELPFEPETARLRPEVWSRWLEHDPVRFVPRHLDAFRKLSSVFIDCGTRDEYSLRWGARMIAEELRSAGVDVLHEEFEDGHTGINYRYDRSVGHLAPRLARG
ncbi:MAG: alpha/beta hydrolase [Myxococcales bacterium]|nr:alpha/beta hydrolase [Myxococcales bacterium]